METEFDVMFKQILLSLNGIINVEYIKLGKRVGNKYQDICIHIPYKSISETRPICCIEVKKINTSGLSECMEGTFTKKLEYSVRQALGYAEANHYIRHNIKVQPFCLLTDGKYIAFLDAKLSWLDNIENLIKYKDTFIKPFTKELYKELFSKFKNSTLEDLLVPNTKHDIYNPHVKEAFKDAETCDSKLARNLLGTHKIFQKLGLDEETSIDYTMQCFLLAILRNCGFVRVEDIDNSLTTLKTNDWLITLLDQWFGKNFKKIEKNHIDTFKEAYSTTRTYDVRIDAMPQEALGYAYESFIKDAKDVKTTEFYTPDILINDVLDRLIPTSKDVIFDPTCGCGSFLIEAVKRIFSSNVCTKQEIEKLSKFLSNNIFGNDRDVYAVCIAKASLLSFFVERLGVDPTTVDIKLPIIKDNFSLKDYFEFKWQRTSYPSLVIGNAPWGDVSSSSENFDDIIGSKKCWTLLQAHRNLNDDRHELSGSIVLKCLNDFSGLKDFRMGILVKQQLLVEDKDAFLKDDRAKDCFFYDYGPLFLFSHTNSLTAIAFFERGTPSKIISKFPRNKINWGKLIRFNSLDCTFYQGVQTGKNNIWKELAKKQSLSSLVVDCIDRTYHKIPIQKPILEQLVYLEPQKKTLTKKDKTRKDLKYIDNYNKRYSLLEKNLSPDQKKILLSMTTGAKVKDKSGKILKESKSNMNYKYTWRRPINEDLISSKWKIIYPNQFTGISKDSRLPVYLTREKVISKTSYTEIIFNSIEDNQAFNILGWMASKVFVHFLEHLAAELKIKRLSGGYELLPEYSTKLQIPEVILQSNELAKLVKSIHSKKIVKEEDLKKIDNKIIDLLKIKAVSNTMQTFTKVKKEAQVKSKRKSLQQDNIRRQKL